MFKVSICSRPCFKLMLRTSQVPIYCLGLLWHTLIKTSLSCDASGMPTGRDNARTVAQRAILFLRDLTGLPSPHLPPICCVMGRGSVFRFLTQDVKREERTSEASQIFLRLCVGDKLQAGMSSFCSAFEEGRWQQGCMTVVSYLAVEDV